MPRRKQEEEEEETTAADIGDDAELVAIAACVSAFEDLDEEQSANVIAYLQRRFGAQA